MFQVMPNPSRMWSYLTLNFFLWPEKYRCLVVVIKPSCFSVLGLGPATSGPGWWRISRPRWIRALSHTLAPPVRRCP